MPAEITNPRPLHCFVLQALHSPWCRPSWRNQGCELGHYRTSTASTRSQWALPDLHSKRQIAVGTTGPQQQALDRSGHYRTSTTNSPSQWTLPGPSAEEAQPDYHKASRCCHSVHVNSKQSRKRTLCFSDAGPQNAIVYFQLSLHP